MQCLKLDLLGIFLGFIIICNLFIVLDIFCYVVILVVALQHVIISMVSWKLSLSSVHV